MKLLYSLKFILYSIFYIIGYFFILVNILVLMYIILGGKNCSIYLCYLNVIFYSIFYDKSLLAYEKLKAISESN